MHRCRAGRGAGGRATMRAALAPKNARGPHARDRGFSRRCAVQVMPQCKCQARDTLHARAGTHFSARGIVGRLPRIVVPLQYRSYGGDRAHALHPRGAQKTPSRALLCGARRGLRWRRRYPGRRETAFRENTRDRRARGEPVVQPDPDTDHPGRRRQPAGRKGAAVVGGRAFRGLRGRRRPYLHERVRCRDANRDRSARQPDRPRHVLQRHQQPARRQVADQRRREQREDEHLQRAHRLVDERRDDEHPPWLSGQHGADRWLGAHARRILERRARRQACRSVDRSRWLAPLDWRAGRSRSGQRPPRHLPRRQPHVAVPDGQRQGAAGRSEPDHELDRDARGRLDHVGGHAQR